MRPCCTFRCSQQWFGLSHLRMEEARSETLLLRDFAGFLGIEGLLYRASILCFRYQLGVQRLATVNGRLAAKGLLFMNGTAIAVTLIAALRSTKNSRGERESEMHQTQNANQ